MGKTAGMDLIMRPVSQNDLLEVYARLLTAYGHQHWWPSEGPVETMAGAILAQNVSWTGASRAVSVLKEHGLLSPAILATTPAEKTAPLIRSSRFYRQKASRLKEYMAYFVSRWNGDVDLMAAGDAGTLRTELLSLQGFGPETVDSILLYALNKPVFVVDAYTRRIGSRLQWFDDDASYQAMQEFFMSRLPPDVALFNDFHAQIVRLGSAACRRRPDCQACPVSMTAPLQNCPYAEKIMSGED